MPFANIRRQRWRISALDPGRSPKSTQIKLGRKSDFLCAVLHDTVYHRCSGMKAPEKMAHVFQAPDTALIFYAMNKWAYRFLTHLGVLHVDFDFHRRPGEKAPTPG